MKVFIAHNIEEYEGGQILAVATSLEQVKKDCEDIYGEISSVDDKPSKSICKEKILKFTKYPYLKLTVEEWDVDGWGI